MSRARRTRQSLGAILLASAAGCAPAAVPREDSVEGRWLQVAPPSDERRWMELGSDGTARGHVTMNFEFDSLPVTKWEIGAPAAPDALCITFGDKTLCSAYLLRADTLRVADGFGGTFVRENPAGTP